MTHLFLALPRITVVDVTSSPLVGDFFFIECTVGGIPQPSTVWIKNGEEVQVFKRDM